MVSLVTLSRKRKQYYNCADNTRARTVQSYPVLKGWQPKRDTCSTENKTMIKNRVFF